MYTLTDFHIVETSRGYLIGYDGREIGAVERLGKVYWFYDRFSGQIYSNGINCLDALNNWLHNLDYLPMTAEDLEEARM